ncbi:MAG: homoserine O-acetyltransferase [Microscillaceae bacterium]|nr:homoserine O-acetyltransferase [Microscillaceae bacterium]
MEEKKFTYEAPFPLESGKKLEGFELAYSTSGTLEYDAQGFCKNVIWICHALTANSDPEDWWSGLVGKDKLFTPEKYFIICANVLGSCYGSTNALSLNPHTGQSYYYDFPLLTIRDIVKAQQELCKYLNINRIHICTGGSMGGQQALEWAIADPDMIEYLIVLATNAQHSPWGIAFNASQRMAIQNDPTWGQRIPEAGIEGMKTARAIALLSYRNYHTYRYSQSEESDDTLEAFKSESYQHYQGEKLARRFHAFSYWTLSKAMDSHHVGRKRGGLASALGMIKSQTLVIGILSDILFPPEEQKFLAQHIPQALYQEIDTLFGHDGFLIETEIIGEIIRNWLQKQPQQKLQPNLKN